MSNDTQNGYPQILNPGEPFAYIPAESGHQLHNFQYVAAATTGMFVWELCNDLSSLHMLFFTSRPTIPATVYLISRISTLLYNVFSLQFLVVGGNCAALYVGVGIFWVFASSCTAMLFFLRVRAIYRDNNLVIGFFALLWLFVVGGSVTIPVVLSGNPNRVGHLLPNNSFCVDRGSFPGYAGSAMIIPAIYDTLVFIAISYRLFPPQEISQDMTRKARASLFFTGQGYPRFTKALLQQGQQYYLISVAANIFSLTFYFAPVVPQPYHVMVTLIHINIINSMACSVYRDVKFGRISERSMASTNVRSTGNRFPIRATPRIHGQVFVNVEVTTVCDESSGSTSRSTKAELPRTSIEPETELYGQK
ncbi:hypothetical protein PENSPDRAFT_389780 [Peniophora sp. CONT]|nr:hypothetical protein PENSPDRAFT_389780 [Peniophora sp. CONT]